MDFPILDLMDQQACYQRLSDLLHPDGLACPRCGGGRPDRPPPPRRRPRSSTSGARGAGGCSTCSPATAWKGTHRTPAEVLLILRGFAQGVPTAKLARELGASRPHLLELRHQVQARAAAASDRRRCRTPTSRPTRCIKTRGKKGAPHEDPDDPPRCRG